VSGGPEPLLEGRGLGKSYRRGSGLGRSPSRDAFAGVDLTLAPGRTLGLLGASGAGKSSLARCLGLLERPDAGTVVYRGVEHHRLSREQLRRFHGDVQLVFQDSARSFNPGWRARRALEEPLRLLAGVTGIELGRRGDRLAERVGLDRGALERRVLELSGGQLKRLNLARALAAEPRVLLLDEPFSGLDVSLQAQIANLLLELQREADLAFLYISHDLSLVSRLADEVMVLERGRVVERGLIESVLQEPQATATRALLAARLELPGAGIAPPEAR
jgi:ABC-type glutathione transport system ATPase component